MRASLRLSALAALTPLWLGAQASTPPASLTVEEAVDLALANNPQYRQTLNTRRSAAAAVRQARGAYLPQLTTSAGFNFREGRAQNFGGLSFGATSNTVGTSGDVSARFTYGLDIPAQAAQATADQRAALADVDAAAMQLRNTVTQQYLAVLQAQARAVLQDTLLESARLNVELARARTAAGAATQLDVQRAEVALGQQRVALLQARNTLGVEQLRLFEQLGITPPSDIIRYTSAFAVTPVGSSLDELVRLAGDGNPAVRARIEREQSAQAGIRVARAAYLPQFSMSASYGGFTNQFTNKDLVLSNALNGLPARNQCFQTESIRGIVGQPSDPASCNAIVLTDAQRQSALDANNTFPFQFTRNPYSLNASLSLPLFDGWARTRRRQEADVQLDNAKQATRQQQLSAQQAARTAWLNLETARQTVALQDENSRLAREALTLAETRYRVGQATFIDVATARGDFARAATDRINAVYDYHRAYAALEQAVGRRLR
jgi:outer membrane protein